MSFITDRQHLDFLLYDLLDTDQLFQAQAFSGYDRGSATQILDTAQTIAETHFLPFAAETDIHEPRFENGQAITPDSTAAALRAFAEAGFFALPFPAEIGGLQAPWVLHMAANYMFNAANQPVAGYAMLTVGAAGLLNAHGSETLKSRFLPPMLEGRWFGTMCLSEPQAGSSLADIRTIAEPQPDGSYRLRGSKMWISGGEQEISENIVHMVLAKIPGGPAGTKGISLFLVPKFRPDSQGNPDERNDITLMGLNHKLGQRGTTNCLLSLGDQGDCHGYLIGEAHRGLEYMFRMMNEARIGVGSGAVASAIAGYLFSADYAKTRPQGRRFDQRDPALPQVPIIEHTDIKRMLLAQKAAVEGAQALTLYAALLVDQIAISTDQQEKASLSGLLDLLTPVVKSWPSEHCLEANKWAIQVLGGYGYTRDYPVERLYRDNRLNHIHEGTFGIQGLDLVRRKVGGDRGQSLGIFLDMMRKTVALARETETLRPDADALDEVIATLETVKGSLLECDQPETQLANATLFLDGFGTSVVGWIWLRQALAAVAGLQAGGDATFLQGKLRTCRYFMRYNLPEAQTRLRLCGTLDTTCLDAPVEMF